MKSNLQETEMGEKSVFVNSIEEGSGNPLLDVGSSFENLGRVLYHHRTQGKAVEGVHIRGITDALRAEGVVVDVMSLPGADPYSSPAAMSPKTQATRLMKVVAKFPEPLFELAELGYNAVAGWRLLRHFFAHKDIGLIYERYSLYMFVSILIARARRIPIVFEVNDSAIVERVRPLFFRSLASAIERFVFRRADGLVFVSKVFRDRIAAEYGSIAPSIVTPNAANISQFSYTSEQRHATRSRLGFGTRIVCGYLGAFVPWHKIDQFVYSIASRLDESPDLSLLLVGDGETYPQVVRFVAERNLQDRIILTGRVAHKDVPGLLSAMDLAVLPSAGDYTSPVKLFEFMATGIPAIAPDFEPIKEVLIEDQNGWMFKANDIEACVEAVINKSAQVESLVRVGNNAREYIKTERQWKNNVTQLARFVGQIRRHS
jgi:glycosyltransferase involved in cell wall biosynthesis